eukprot:1158153-Pelagomonas_calceolata.AAC.2
MSTPLDDDVSCHSCLVDTPAFPNWLIDPRSTWCRCHACRHPHPPRLVCPPAACPAASAAAVHAAMSASCDEWFLNCAKGSGATGRHKQGIARDCKKV